MTRLKGISLREKKYARTKLALLDAAIARLKNRSFEAISVKELCDEAMVSEATFFNYFPKKSDLLVYFVQVWSIDVAWHARSTAQEYGAIRAIEAIFARTAERARNRPRVMNEIIAFLARQRDEMTFRPVSTAERLMAYPDWDDLDALPDDAFESLLEPYLKDAVANGELPPTTSPAQTRIMLETIFFGVPLALGIERAADVDGVYQEMLQLTWRGLRSANR